MKRKYLHVEIQDGTLYIYADNESYGGSTMTLLDMDKECSVADVTGNDHIHIKIPLKDFVKDK